MLGCPRLNSNPTTFSCIKKKPTSNIDLNFEKEFFLKFNVCARSKQSNHVVITKWLTIVGHFLHQTMFVKGCLMFFNNYPLAQPSVYHQWGAQ